VTGWQAFRFGMLLGAIYGLLREPRAFACCGCLLALVTLFAILVAGTVVVIYWKWLILLALVFAAWQLWVRRRR
jgi:xanthosine utilization system XapX-like protein